MKLYDVKNIMNQYMHTTCEQTDMYMGIAEHNDSCYIGAAI